MDDNRIIKTEYSELMQKSYIDYAMSVIVARALPDVRDGLKPVQRRVLYDMYELGIRHDRPYRKSARIVGDTMGKYHPHGDSSIYDALVVMAQDFKKGQTLIDGHGNFGNIEGDGAAAMRYTEARLEKLTQDAFLEDLDKDVVDFVPNFDETEKEPAVLPCKLPNLLVNGSEGIAVGMATSIPPHNLGEVVDAVKAYMQDETISTRELMRFLQGPDFPTGGIVTNKDELLSIYETGTGKIRLRGRVETEKGKNGRINVVITEIPYTMIGANIGKFLSDVAALAETKKTTDIVDISNQSSKEGIRIVIELKKDADADNFINMLYKKTRLEDTFGVNMLAIAGGRPETLGLKQIIKANVEFQFEVNRRKYETLLKKEQAKREIQEGLIKACNVIDLIIEILRGSRDRAMAKACLVEGITEGIRFKSRESAVMAAQLRFSENQANAILDMRLYRLIGLEIEALVREHEETVANIYRYEDILERKSAMAQVIINDLDALKKEYARKRSTRIDNCTEAVFEEKKVEEIQVYCLIDKFGYTRTVDAAAYERNQEAALSENRFVFPVKNTGRVCLFTDTGQLYTVKVSDLPFGKFRDKAVPLDNVSNYDSTKEQLLLAVGQSDLNLYRLLFFTRQGMAKLVDGGEFDVMKRTVAATKLQEGDSVADVTVYREQKYVTLQSKEGFFLRFLLEEIPEKKKNAVGVRAIKLSGTDELEAVYYTGAADDTSISYKSRTLALNQLKLAHRDGRGTKVRG
ncbi:MAG: DNA topoisomerase (ATP-hydrolyzing) [Eubacteriales bacterium]|nr:DNA topoisomerase (ATP-hydrolyzing) [Eubacteriales bacterium]